MNDTFLILFLAVNLFVIGIVATLAYQYARAHYRPKVTPAQTQVLELPSEVKQRLLQAAEIDFKNVMTKTSHELEHDQQQLADHLGRRLDSLGTAIVDDEMKRYRAKLDELRANAEYAIGSAQAETTKHQNEINAALEKKRSEVEASMIAEAKDQREKLSKQLDARLADAVLAFLNETLGHNIDIGAQRPYLIAMLEEHKQELIEGVVRDESATS